MSNEKVILLVAGMILVTIIAVHYANKGVPVQVGTPLFGVKIN